MIKVDQAALDAALRRFDQVVALKAAQTGVNAKRCIAVEASRLADTMLRITPPLTVGPLKSKIASQVSSKFGSLNSDVTSRHTPGASGINWYAFEPLAIYGVATEQDMTRATVEQLYDLYFKTKLNKQGRIVAGKRGQQTVYIWQKILTKAATVRALTKRLQDHVGRAKASWLPAWTILKSFSGIGSGTVPDYIARNARGARGTFTNGLESPGNPNFTMRSFAKGIGSAKMRQIAHDALVIRSAAIIKRLTILQAHPEKVMEEM